MPKQEIPACSGPGFSLLGKEPGGDLSFVEINLPELCLSWCVKMHTPELLRQRPDLPHAS